MCLEEDESRESTNVPVKRGKCNIVSIQDHLQWDISERSDGSIQAHIRSSVRDM